MSMVYDHLGNPKYFGIYMGFVVSNRDPGKLGRVTVRVPGLIEPESGWAWPLGTGGGSVRNGAWDVPKSGATIGVAFHQGEIDAPLYFHGWYAREMSPEPIENATKEDAADKIKCFESDRHLVLLDGRSGSEQVLIKDKETGNCVVLKNDRVFLGGDEMMPMEGVVNGEARDPYTGMTQFQLGNASKVVFGKKG